MPTVINVIKNNSIILQLSSKPNSFARQRTSSLTQSDETFGSAAAPPMFCPFIIYGGIHKGMRELFILPPSLRRPRQPTLTEDH